MMKKILYILGLMMFASIVAKPLYVLAEGEQFSSDVPFSTSRIFTKIMPNFVSDNMFESFGNKDPEAVGKDLYMKVLKKTIVNPEEETLKRMANKYGTSQTNINFIRSGNLQPIYERNPSMTQEMLVRKAAQVQKQYNDMLEELQLEAEIEAATSPSEIFANNDTSDSGFDLIVDLDIIEKLLFLRSDPFYLGRDYNKQENSGSNSQQQGQTPQQQQNQPGQNTPQIQPEPGTKKTCKKKVESGTGEVNLSGGMESLGVNPESCFGNSALKGALDKYSEDHPEQENYTEECESETESSQSSGPDETTATVIPVTDDPFPEAEQPATEPVTPAPADDWSRKKICVGKFCLDVKMVYENPTSQYANPDNCIACHIEKINDVMKKVISHSLSPSKITGNPLETPQCKNGLSASLSAVSMNVNIQFMPIKTPLNDDLIFNSDLANDWKYLCDTTALFPASMCKVDPEPAVVIQDPPTPDQQLLDRELSYSTENDSQVQVITNLDNAAQKYLAPSVKTAEELQMEKSANSTISLYRSVVVELDQMNYYFANIKDILHSLHEKVNGVSGTNIACTDLKNKKTCQ